MMQVSMEKRTHKEPAKILRSSLGEKQNKTKNYSSTSDPAAKVLLTLKAPRRKRVGSRPTEKMRRRMVMMTSARTPSGWGMMMTMMSVAKTPIHSSADRWGSSITASVETRNKQTRTHTHKRKMC